MPYTTSTTTIVIAVRRSGSARIRKRSSNRAPKHSMKLR